MLGQNNRLSLYSHCSLHNAGCPFAHRNGEALLDHDAAPAMSDAMKDKRNPVSGGFALGMGALIGGLWGVHYGQPVLGLGGGIAFGGAITLIVWLVDRQRD
jgi:hypothetical protein